MNEYELRVVVTLRFAAIGLRDAHVRINRIRAALGRVACFVMERFGMEMQAVCDDPVMVERNGSRRVLVSRSDEA